MKSLLKIVKAFGGSIFKSSLANCILKKASCEHLNDCALKVKRDRDEERGQMKIIVKGLVIVLLGGLGVVVAGCGRKGSLEMPPASVEKSVKGTSAAKSEDDQPFILDRLIK